MVDHTSAVGRFEQWLQTDFVDLNTELEEAYYAAGTEILTRPDLDVVKQAIAHHGAKLIVQIADEAPTAADERGRYQLLGAVGLYLASCGRHKTDIPQREQVWSLANLLGTSLGVAPRYVFAHQVLHGYRTFTTLADERLFVTYNGLGVLAYQRAADALRRVPAVGVSSPLAAYLLDNAAAALGETLRSNRVLAETLDVDRFFLNIRPYFRPHRVADVVYRGVNAGDFAAVNEIDLLLGLCSARDPFYQRIVAEKYPYVPPEEQAPLRAATTTTPLLELFLRETAAGPMTPQLTANAERFLAVCRAHGAAYTFHHHRLVKPFLEAPAKLAPPERSNDITASGPPLQTVIAALEHLRDLRAAHDRPGLEFSAHTSLDRLRRAVEAASAEQAHGSPKA